MLRERVSYVSSELRSSDVMKLVEEDIERSASLDEVSAAVWKERLSRKSAGDMHESLLGSGHAKADILDEEEVKENLNM